MKKFFIIPVCASLFLLTMCEQSITGSGDYGKGAEMEPGLYIASMDVGSNYLEENSSSNSGGKVITIEKFGTAPIAGELAGVFEGSICAECDMMTNGRHKGNGLIGLSNGIVFEVEMSGNTVDGRDSGFLQGFDMEGKYRIEARYTEVNGSCRGDCSRPLKLEAYVSRYPE